MPSPSALVIGAGLGDIAAARLARSGYDVMVLEKNSKPCGRCDQFVRVIKICILSAAVPIRGLACRWFSSLRV